LFGESGRGRTRTCPRLTDRATGSLAAPRTTRPSIPENFSSGPLRSMKGTWQRWSQRGERNVPTRSAEAGAKLPVSGPVPNTRLSLS